jgi:hypothetical protein
MAGLNDNYQAKSKTRELTCRLTSPELRERKAAAIANLKKQILMTKELKNGFSYRFTATDSLVDELVAL